MAPKKLTTFDKYAIARKALIVELKKMQTEYSKLDVEINRLQDKREELDQQMGNIEDILEGDDD